MEKQLILRAAEAALIAGEAILEVYNQSRDSFQIESKEDDSPLTIADKKAHQLISKHLNSLDIPILSEEGILKPFDQRKIWECLWIVDPLDGTKEFIKKNGEFTVNIALVKNGVPILGVIYIPVQNTLYIGSQQEGAYKIEHITNQNTPLNYKELIENSQQLPIYTNKSTYKVAASRSHLSKETEQYIHTIKETKNDIEWVTVGSSIKFCWLAEGLIDIYPRFSPTMEWDTAAGHAIVLGAGKMVFQVLEQHKPLVYNKENLLNPWFIAK